MVSQIEAELKRVGASEVKVQLEQRPHEHKAHVKLALGQRSCLVEAEGFLQTLQGMPDRAGIQAVSAVLQESARHDTKWATE